MTESADPDGAVAAAIERAFPDRAVASVDDPGPSWNDDNRAVEVTFEHGEPARAYLKVALDGDGSRVRRERAVLAYVQTHRSVPVPEVLAAAPDADPPHLATRPMAGRSLRLAWDDADPDRRATLARAAGRTLAAVHAERFEEHGRVVGGDAEALAIDRRSWPDLLTEQVERVRDRAAPTRFEDHFDRVLATVDAERAALTDVPAALVHGDPAQPNATWTGETVGLLDWELTHVGDPARELVRACRQVVEPLREPAEDRLVEALHEGYRDRAGGLPEGFAERRPLYRAVTFLGTSAFFERWAPWFDEPEADLAAWTEREMGRRLDAV